MALLDTPERRAKKAAGDYRWLMGLAVVTGCAALVGWGWAIVLALVPVSVPVPGAEPGVACGRPALFDASKFPHAPGDDESFDKYWSDQCADKVSLHIRETVGLSVVRTPLSALWVWSACTLPGRRAEMESTAAALPDSAATDAAVDAAISASVEATHHAASHHDGGSDGGHHH